MIENELIHPSPAIVVRSDAPMSECVRKMRDYRVGSVLVVSAVDEGKLAGIFTERDLVDHVDEIQDADFWSQPVSEVMTRPVITLPVSRLRDALDVMTKNGFRHLPIVTNKGNLIGIVSMRDLFKRIGERSAGRILVGEFRKPVRVGVIDPGPELDPDFYRSALKLLNGKAVRLPLEAFSNPARKEQIESLDALFLDLDLPGADALIRVLGTRRSEVKFPFTVVLFSPALHPGRRVRALLRLNQAEHLAVFARPVNLLTFLRRVRSGVQG